MSTISLPRARSGEQSVDEAAGAVRVHRDVDEQRRAVGPLVRSQSTRGDALDAAHKCDVARANGVLLTQRLPAPVVGHRHETLQTMHDDE
jgi:hypothetical protein